MKIKKEQLKVIQDQQRELNAIMHEVGVLEAQKHGLLHKFADINRDVEDIKNELKKEYGAVNINIETGEYTEIEEEKELSKVE
jgi:vacuolar-type H+-ATPase subunit D/Vma8